MKSITEPPETRKFKVPGGLRTFTRVKYKRHLQEVLIVARATKKPAPKRKGKKTEVTDDEIDELESVDELEDDDEDLEDDDDLEDEDDDEEDEDDEDEDEPDDEDEDDDSEEDDDEDDEEEDEEPPKRSRKPKKSRAAAEGKVGTNEIAEKAGVDSRTLRMVLRKHKVKKDPETKRYQWASFKDPTVKKILKWLADGEAEEIKQESLSKLKETQEAKRAAAKKTAKKGTKPAAGTKKKKRRRPVEDDDDE